MRVTWMQSCTGIIYMEIKANFLANYYLLQQLNWDKNSMSNPTDKWLSSQRGTWDMRAQQ